MESTTPAAIDFSNFGSLKSTETYPRVALQRAEPHFSNFGSLKSTETAKPDAGRVLVVCDFSNFGSLKSTETRKVLYLSR